ncbi:hypothetical protein TREMEDRAFT_69537 [Tremella mesenterica DSM 1558]|uniref:uncharacterized protein n=1 Tax=Tremella mesenterica (strain ATCC 24925 / CBS 8224 / DSM 1558 / NBRC 9311 / NRRL Y-6157 / RJB 2259-6 / UBC 559-6) TaxID=578456 RepID=UPI0003F49A70|nr:uncharacterized protein TREMEDRAFT_69537 [Tremella mesenterica DSM 1558]EIW68045.1 hypothetical protein TREMEDRAFT_69537 [Tremella mesenterica DSM 1558]
MSDALPDDAWVNNFLDTPPRPLLTALQRRLQASTSHANALAEVYKQRASVEAAYAEGLAKLVRSAESGQLAGKGGIEWGKDGAEGKLWDSVLNDLRETSTSHSTLSALLKTDFETPLREMPQKIVAWRRITEQDLSLDRTLKEYEKVSQKRDKAEAKARGGKAELLQQEVNQLSSQLVSLSPLVYTTYQKLDEERLRTLKEIIVRFCTLRGDMSARDGERADTAIASLLGWETQDEVRLVGQRLGSMGVGQGSRGPLMSSVSSTNTTPRTVRRLSSVPSVNNDFSPRPPMRQNGSGSGVAPGTPTGGFAGLKSILGRKNTVVGRGRSNSIPNSTRSGGRDLDAFETLNEEDGNQGTVRQRPAPSIRTVDNEGFTEPPPDRHRNPWEDPNELIPTPATSSPRASSQTTSANPPQLPAPSFGQTFEASPTTSQDNLSSSASSQHQPGKLNLAMSTIPIQETDEERQLAVAKIQAALSLPQQPTRRGTVARGRRDVRNTMFGGNVDTTLNTSGLGNLQESTMTMTESPIQQHDNLPSSPTGSTNIIPLGPVVTGTGMNGFDPHTPGKPSAQRRTSSASIISNNPFDSPGLNFSPPTSIPGSTMQEGLRANMLETINTVIRSGIVTKVQITGEIHFSLSLSSFSTSSPIHIRLTSFESLEKIAPNPTYLSQVPDNPGEYYLNPETLSQASKTSIPKGVLLFKYQAHLSQGTESTVLPILLEPAFQKIIVNYKLNPESLLSSSLSDEMTLSAAFGPGVGVKEVQAKPAGAIWSPNTRRMTWRVPLLNGGNNIKGGGGGGGGGGSLNSPAGGVGIGGKAVARLVTEEGEPLVPLAVAGMWKVDGMLGSGLGIEVVEGGINFDQVKKGTMAGKYLAEPV